MFGVFILVRPFSPHPEDPLPSKREELEHLAGAPTSQPAQNRPFPRAIPEAELDPELDVLLGRIAPTLLRTGFAERVLQSIGPSETVRVHRKSLTALGSGALRAFGIAASLAFCCGLAWWSVSSPSTRLALSSARSFSAPSEEELLLKALATLEVHSGDLALVAQLGDVLEAELTERTSWLEKE